MFANPLPKQSEMLLERGQFEKMTTREKNLRKQLLPVRCERAFHIHSPSLSSLSPLTYYDRIH